MPSPLQHKHRLHFRLTPTQFTIMKPKNTVQAFPVQCKHFLYSASISYTVQAFPVQCKHFLYSASISCTVQAFPIQCKHFLYSASISYTVQAFVTCSLLKHLTSSPFSPGSPTDPFSPLLPC